MELGRRIYYEKSTGNVIFDTGERAGDVVETTVDQDYEMQVTLNGRTRETVGIIELDYKQYSQDFAECKSYRVNPSSKTLEFSYPMPGEGPAVPVYQIPLTEQIATLEQRTEANEAALLALLDFGL